MRGVILSGGRGTRLGIDTPKSLIEIIRDMPILQYLIGYMECMHIHDITCISDVEKPVRPWLESNYPKIRIVDQQEPMGTGQAVHLALKDISIYQLRKRGLLVMLGGIIPTSLMFLHAIWGAPQHSMLGVYESDTPQDGAVVEIDRKGWLTKVTAKPENRASNTILSGIFYFANSELFFTAQEKLMRFNVKLKGEYDIIGAIRLMHQYGESFKCVENRIFDCGTDEGIKKAREYFASNANGA